MVAQLRQAGIAAAAANNHQAAAEAFARAIALRPGDGEVLSRLALARLSLGDLATAQHLARKAASLAGDNAAVLDRLGHILSSCRAFEEGFELFRRAIGAAPYNPAFLRNFAWGAQYVGDLPAAQAALMRVLDLNPEDGMAWSTLTALPGWSATDQDISHLRRLADRPRSVPDGLAIGHALARALESRGDYAGAIAALSVAKRARLEARPYDVGRDLALFEAAATHYHAGPTGRGLSSDAPIFIVGPPRSGTTLLDRIISSHSQVTSAGELGVMILLVLNTAGASGAGPLTGPVLARAAQADAAIMARRYLEAAKVVVGAAGRFTDKRPFNLILAGFIHRMLPNARIVRMRRHPADATLGNYRQFFNLGSAHHDFSYDLVSAARYISGLEALSEFWEANLPADRYRVVDYEALVADPRGQIAAVLDFCGLDWDPACLEFHKNTTGVSTASAAQVREPLHDRNIGLWRRYGDALQPALNVLRAAGRLD